MTAQQFVWYELATTDIEAATAFYGRVLDWTAREFAEGSGYWIVSAEGRGVGGIMQLPDGMRQPLWLGYVGTGDIETSAEKFRADGGTVRKLWDIPEVGRLALMSDPQGVGLAMIQGASTQASAAFDQSRNGHCNWHELRTVDPEAAMTFYTSQFGWKPDSVMEMGPMGAYHIFAVEGAQAGGMMRVMDGAPPMWLYYFGVQSIDAAIEVVGEAGGAVLHGPDEVPGGAWVIQARDPQSAMFALVGRR